jgi:hypothetical protein
LSTGEINEKCYRWGKWVTTGITGTINVVAIIVGGLTEAHHAKGMGRAEVMAEEDTMAVEQARAEVTAVDEIMEMVVTAAEEVDMGLVAVDMVPEEDMGMAAVAAGDVEVADAAMTDMVAVTREVNGAQVSVRH